MKCLNFEDFIPQSHGCQKREIVTEWIWSATGKWLMKWLIDPIKCTFWISSINCLLEEFSITKNWFPVKWFLKIKGHNSAHRRKISSTTWPKSPRLAGEKGHGLGSWTVMGRRSTLLPLSFQKSHSSCWLPTARSGHMPFPQLLSSVNYWWTVLGSQSSNSSESTWQ